MVAPTTTMSSPLPRRRLSLRCDDVEVRPAITHSDGAVHLGDYVPPSAVPPLGLDGCELDCLIVLNDVRLQFGDTLVVFGTPFMLTSVGWKGWLDPEERAALGPLLAIYPATLLRATVDEGLTLRLEFDTGARLEAPPYEQFEAWQIQGPGARRIVCPPGRDGLLAVWV